MWLLGSIRNFKEQNMGREGTNGRHKWETLMSHREVQNSPIKFPSFFQKYFFKMFFFNLGVTIIEYRTKISCPYRFRQNIFKTKKKSVF